MLTLYREQLFLTGHVNFGYLVQKYYELGVRRFAGPKLVCCANDYEKDIKFASETFSKMLDDIQKGEKKIVRRIKKIVYEANMRIA